jgi:hypothetical protein
MQLSFVVVLALAICGASAVDIDEGVYVGTDENFQSIIESTEFVLAEFCTSDDLGSVLYEIDCGGSRTGS